VCKATALNGIPVVVKSLLWRTPEWNPQKKVDMDFIPEEEMAHCEAWAYTKLVVIVSVIEPAVECDQT
jgi:hypothetical protein